MARHIGRTLWLGRTDGALHRLVLFCLARAACFSLDSPAGSTQSSLGWYNLCAAKSGAFLAYGVDHFMTIGLFYLMLSPLPDRYSADWQLRKLRPKNRQLLGFFWQRVLQLHLCVIYFFSGLTKCLGSGWWDGSSVWRALIRPPFNIIDPELLVRWKYLFPVVGIFICCTGNWIPVSYLEQQDTNVLADLYLCALCMGNWFDYGDVSLWAGHDHSQCRGVCAKSYLLASRSTTPPLLLRKLFRIYSENA